MNNINLHYILDTIPKILSSSNDSDKTMLKITDTIKSALLTEYVGIYYFSENYAYLKHPEEDKNFNNFSLNSTILERIETEPYITLSAVDSNFQLKDHQIYLFPLKIRETIFGFICIASKSPITDKHITAITSLASAAAYAIKDAEMSNVFKIQLRALQSSVIEKAQDVKTIQEQNEKILEADKIKTEFLANISHELRTPLNAIIGFSEVLSSNIFGELNPKQTEYVNDIYTSGVHLLGMINEILDISKLEANAMKLTYNNFLLKDSIEEVVRVMQPLAQKKVIKLNLNCNTDKKVCLDRQKLQQILYNLLSNAIKFTPEQGKVDITAEIKQNTTTIIVQDTGIGIEKEAQKKIFEKFVQLENTYTKTGSSTGLGLTITKRFVEMMNGTIELESEKDKGSKFIINFMFENN